MKWRRKKQPNAAAQPQPGGSLSQGQILHRFTAQHGADPLAGNGPPIWGLDHLQGELLQRTGEEIALFEQYNPPQTYQPEPHDWYFAMGSIYRVLNTGAWRTLTYPRPDQAASMLRQSWGISSRSGLLSTLDWLFTEGHRNNFAVEVHFATSLPPEDAQMYDDHLANESDEEARWRLRQVVANTNRIRDVNFLAWDYARIPFLCSMGYTAGFITPQEAYDAGVSVQYQIQSNYDSWEQVGRDFSLGRWFWAAEGDDRLIDSLANINALLVNGGVWRGVPFDSPLPQADGSFTRALHEVGIHVPAQTAPPTPIQSPPPPPAPSATSTATTPTPPAPGEPTQPRQWSAPVLPPLPDPQPTTPQRFGADAIDLRTGPYRGRAPFGRDGWLISLGAVDAEMVPMYHDGINPIPEGDPEWQAFLERRESMYLGGADWPTRLEQMSHFEGDLSPHAAFAAGLSRYVATVRIGVALEKVNERQGLKLINKAAGPASGLFDSWESYAHALNEAIGGAYKGSTPVSSMISDMFRPGMPWGDVPWQP